ncbi:MAG: Gfo/Idh/MocA family oxidoreductase [Gammaproteobacteria bacterium]
MKRIRFGMVGGGEGAFIGAVHRTAAALDGEYGLVCGAFASDAARSREFGIALDLPPERSHSSYEAMFAAEAALPADKRMEVVAIVTPNHLHLPVARAALQRGFHVLCDKPATLSLAECLALRDAVAASGRLYGLTHPYSAYPLVVEAAQRVRSGELGTIRKVIVEYTQGWLAEPIERRGQKQAAWRSDPNKAGASGCMGDIGVHAFQLAELVSGLRTTQLCADLNRVVPGRTLDDDGTVLMRFANGASGTLVASQICTGDENDLRLRVYGDAAGLEWNQQEPNTLRIKPAHAPIQELRTGGPGLSAAAQAHARLPSGHPEGYLEAFANLYRTFAAQVRAHATGATPTHTVPGIDTALRGMAFIDTVVAANTSAQKWHPFPEVGT